MREIVVLLSGSASLLIIFADIGAPICLLKLPALSITNKPNKQRYDLLVDEVASAVGCKSFCMSSDLTLFIGIGNSIIQADFCASLMK